MKWYRRLGVIIPVITLLLALGPLALFGINTARRLERTLMQDIQKSNHMAITHAILQTEMIIQHTLDGMFLAADTLELNDADEMDAPYALQLIQKEIPELRLVALLDEDGKEIAKLSLDAIYQSRELKNRAHEPEFVQALQNQPYIGQVTVSDEGAQRLTLAIPLVDPRDRTVSGVLTAQASVRNLLEDIASMGVLHGGFIFVADPKGNIIAHPDLSRVLSGQSIAENMHFQHFLKGDKEHLQELHRHLNPEGRDVLSMGLESGNLGWVFMLEQPVDQALATVNTLKRELKLSLAILVAVSMAGALYLVFGLAWPLQKLQSAAAGMASGNLEQHVDVDSGNEIGLVAREFNTMAEKLSRTAREQVRRDWFKTGQVELDDHIRGRRTLPELSLEIITFLSTYLGARVGALYVKESDDTLHLKAGYAHQGQNGGAKAFKMGEGLVGQAALDAKTTLLDNVPEDYIQVFSGLGETRPASLMVVPILHEGLAVGVMEFGFLETVSDIKSEFLKDVSERVAIAVIAIQEREKLQETLQTSQNMSEELAAQQEELRVANEELEEMTRSLQTRGSDA